MNNSTDLKEFIKEDILLHRNLFDGKPGHRLPKTTFTLKDLRKYYIVCTKGTSLSSSLNSTTFEEREQIKDHLCSNTREFLPDEISTLENLLEKFGLQVILYSISELTELDFSTNSSYRVIDGLPHISILNNYIQTSVIYLTKLLKEKQQQ